MPQAGGTQNAIKTALTVELRSSCIPSQGETVPSPGCCLPELPVQSPVSSPQGLGTSHHLCPRNTSGDGEWARGSYKSSLSYFISTWKTIRRQLNKNVCVSVKRSRWFYYSLRRLRREMPMGLFKMRLWHYGPMKSDLFCNTAPSYRYVDCGSRFG